MGLKASKPAPHASLEACMIEIIDGLNWNHVSLWKNIESTDTRFLYLLNKLAHNRVVLSEVQLSNLEKCTWGFLASDFEFEHPIDKIQKAMELYKEFCAAKVSSDL